MVTYSAALYPKERQGRNVHLSVEDGIKTHCGMLVDDQPASYKPWKPRARAWTSQPSLMTCDTCKRVYRKLHHGSTPTPPP